MPIIKYETESEWLQARKKNINSTEVSALFGLSQYKSRLRLWHEKAGNIEDDFIETPFTDWGRYLQAPVGVKICHDNGWHGEDMTGVYMYDENIRIGASMDVLAKTEKGEKILLEIKVAERLTEEMGWTKTRCPIEYEFQIQAQLHLANKLAQGINKGVIGTLAARQRVSMYPRSYDAELGALIDKEALKFWKSIEENTPPDPDFSVDSEVLERVRGKIREGDIINLSQNEKAIELAEAYQKTKSELDALKEVIKPVEKQLNTIKTEILHLMKRNESAKIGDFFIKAPIVKREDSVVYGSEYRIFNLKKRK